MTIKYLAAVAAVLAAAVAGCADDDPNAWRDCSGDDARDHVRVEFASGDELNQTVESMAKDDRMAAVLPVEETPASLYVLPAPDLPADDLAEQLESEMSMGLVVEVIRC